MIFLKSRAKAILGTKSLKPFFCLIALTLCNFDYALLHTYAYIYPADTQRQA